MWHYISRAMYQQMLYIILSISKVLKWVRITLGEKQQFLFRQPMDLKEKFKSQQEYHPLRDHLLNEKQAIELQQLQLTKNLTDYLKRNDNLNRLIHEEQFIKKNTQFSEAFKLYYYTKHRKLYLELIQQTTIYHINQQISSDNPEVLIFVLSECLQKDQNRTLIQTNSSSRIDLESLFYPNATDFKCLKFHTISEEFDAINNDLNKKAKFILNFKKKVSQTLNLPFSDIDIYDLVKGSIEIYFTIKSKENLNQNELQALEQVCCGRIEVYHYFACGYDQSYGKPVGLSSEDFFPEYNKSWAQNYQEKVQRGPNYHKYDYYYPKGYYGYALNIKNRYGQDQSWLQKDGNDQEWRILYHGTKQQRMQSLVQNGLIPGTGQSFKGYKCQYSGELVGNGVYFSDKTQVCLGYTSETKIGDKVFVLIFQSRVNPKAVRASPEMVSTGNFLVKETKDIRPYRILLNENIEVIKGLLPGGNQWYQSCYCQYTGQKVGSGVYFSNKIQVCLGYTQETLIKTYIGSRKFVLIFQSRVNPKAVRASKEMEQSGIFVVNNTFEIRPYRILLKQFI